jgi:hypothetical protein
MYIERQQKKLNRKIIKKLLIVNNEIAKLTKASESFAIFKLFALQYYYLQ